MESIIRLCAIENSQVVKRAEGRLARGVASHGEPHLLHQLVRGRRVSQVALKIAPYAHFVAPIEQLERRCVAAGVAADQSLVTIRPRPYYPGVWHSRHYDSIDNLFAMGILSRVALQDGRCPTRFRRSRDQHYVRIPQASLDAVIMT